ncbi:MAG TPA: hypothetical protein VGG01_22395 [Xanthobacteraceae bacterium]|jgi:hypothetical protein
MSRYAYDYSLTPARPTGWRATFTTITVVGTVMAVSAISGALVTLDLFGAPADASRIATAIPDRPVPQPVAAPLVHAAAKAASAPAAASHNVAPPPTTTATVAPPTTVAAAQATSRVPPPPAAAPALTAPAQTAPAQTAPAQTASAQPAPVAAVPQQPAPAPAALADSDLTFAKGYAMRQAAGHGAVTRHGKVVVEAKTQLGRAAVKSKPKAYAHNNSQDRRRVETARAAPQPTRAYGMFDRFDRPDQFNFARHQTLAFGEQRMARRRNDAPPPRPSGGLFGNSSGGLFGGLF